MKTYQRCLITGCSEQEVLEAAHISPFSDGGSYDLANGLLFRSDIHILFDSYLLAIDNDMRVVISPYLKDEFYQKLSNKQLLFLPGTAQIPNKVALEDHLIMAKAKWKGEKV